MKALPESDSTNELLKALVQLSYAVLLMTSFILLYTAFGDKLESWAKKGKVPAVPEGFVYNGSSLVDSNGIHVATGLMYGPGITIVQRHCLACHSSKLITQNSATREGWEQTIRWMQLTQGLWDLGSDESIVLEYLEKYYAPVEKGRRLVLNQDEIVWYELKE